MSRKWINIADQKPEEGQPVFYYFKLVGVRAGNYTMRRLGDSFLDCFYGESGYLCDDVTHWMVREEGDSLPDAPELEGEK